MNTTILQRRLKEIEAAYRQSCSSLIWLIAHSSLAIAENDTDISDLLSKANYTGAGGEDSSKLIQDITAIAEQFKKMAAQGAPMLYEMGLIYRVALYDAYIHDLLESVLLHNPDMLKSNRTITHEEALELAASGTLVENLADRAMMEFGYKRLTEQGEWVSRKFGFSMFPAANDVPQLVEIMERRNLFVHSNGVVGAKYVRNVSSTGAKIGDRLGVTDNYWNVADQLLNRLGSTVLTSIRARFLPSAPKTQQEP